MSEDEGAEEPQAPESSPDGLSDSDTLDIEANAEHVDTSDGDLEALYDEE